MGALRRRPGCASGSASTCRPCTATTASCSGCPTSSSTTRARAPRPSCSSLIALEPDDVHDLVTERDRRVGAVRRRGSASAPRGPCCCRGAGPTGVRPLWQQRQRAAQLLEVASQYASFPIVLETVRECVQDVFDVPGLVELMRRIGSRAVAAGRGRDAARPRRSPAVADVRLRRAVPLRGRLAAGRAARRGPRRSTRPCWPSCSAGARALRCATCSTPTPLSRTEAELQRARARAALPATPRTSPTCSGCSAPLPHQAIVDRCVEGTDAKEVVDAGWSTSRAPGG